MFARTKINGKFFENDMQKKREQGNQNRTEIVKGRSFAYLAMFMWLLGF